MFRWYVINTYSGHENKVKQNLEHRVHTMGQERNVRQVVVPTEQVMELSITLAQELNALPPLAVRWTKVSINKWIKHQLNLILDASIAYEMLSINSRDHHEAAKAFIEKRKPVFKGI